MSETYEERMNKLEYCEARAKELRTAFEHCFGAFEAREQIDPIVEQVKLALDSVYAAKLRSDREARR